MWVLGAVDVSTRLKKLIFGGDRTEAMWKLKIKAFFSFHIAFARNTAKDYISYFLGRGSGRSSKIHC